MAELHIRIDEEACAASAMCQRIAPPIFSMPDDADTAIVLIEAVDDPAQVALAQEAAKACPTGAIIIEESP